MWLTNFNNGGDNVDGRRLSHQQRVRLNASPVILSVFTLWHPAVADTRGNRQPLSSGKTCS
jgi:hypothetical protein